jgi:hypothetical protein
VYRELRNLGARGLVEAGAPGPRDRRPFAVTDAGRQAFAAWIARDPGPEQMRFPLLVTLWFGRHLGPDVLAQVVDAQRAEHGARLAKYERAMDEPATRDPYVGAVVDFGVRYERMLLEWLDTLDEVVPPSVTRHPDGHWTPD